MVKTIYKATQQDINMPVDKKLQRIILKNFFWGLGIWTVIMIFTINFLFYVIRGS